MYEHHQQNAFFPFINQHLTTDHNNTPWANKTQNDMHWSIPLEASKKMFFFMGLVHQSFNKMMELEMSLATDQRSFTNQHKITLMTRGSCEWKKIL